MEVCARPKGCFASVVSLISNCHNEWMCVYNVGCHEQWVSTMYLSGYGLFYAIKIARVMQNQTYDTM